MSFAKNFGLFVIIIGITITVLNAIIMRKINITSLQKSNMRNLVIGIILFVTGVIIFYSTGYKDKIKFNFG